MNSNRVCRLSGLGEVIKMLEYLWGEIEESAHYNNNNIKAEELRTQEYLLLDCMTVETPGTGEAGMGGWGEGRGWGG